MADNLKEIIRNSFINLISKPENIEAFLKMKRLLSSKYSLNNQILIFSQKPTATVVMPYSKWKEYNRNVKKGEKAIKIFCPIIKKIVAKDSDGNIQYNSEGKVKYNNYISGFRLGNVFDISQTEGEPFEIGNEIEEYEFAEYNDLKNRISLDVIEKDLPNNLYGYFMLEDQSITINSTHAENIKTATLIHELAHGLIHTEFKIELNRYVEEAIAEFVSFFICKELNIDTERFSSSYILNYINNFRNNDELISNIIEISVKIIDVIEKSIQSEKCVI